MLQHVMVSVQNTENKSGILHETTRTLHKQESGIGEFQTPCGHLYHVAQEKLRIVEIPTGTNKHHMSKCGQCFEEGGGY